MSRPLLGVKDHGCLSLTLFEPGKVVFQLSEMVPQLEHLGVILSLVIGHHHQGLLEVVLDLLVVQKVRL